MCSSYRLYECICEFINIIITMSHKNLRLVNSENQQQLSEQRSSSRRIRQVYIVPPKDTKPQSPLQSNRYTNSTYKMYKTQYNKNGDLLPPKSTLFRRSRERSKDESPKDQTQYHNTRREGSIELAAKCNSRVSMLERKLLQEQKEKQMLVEKNMSYQLKVLTLQEQISKLRFQQKELQKQMLHIERQFEQNKKTLAKANEEIHQLNKNVKQNKINLKSLSNLKNIQNQVEYLQERNKKLAMDNEELNRQVRKKRIQFSKDKQSTSESEEYKHECKVLKRVSRVREQETSKGKRGVKEQELKGHSSRQRLLESNLYQLEKKLYDKQNQINKLQIQLNCIDRKQILSIDHVKQKKDQEIKDLRQKFLKISKDLKEAKDKMQKNEKTQKKKGIRQKANLFFKKAASCKHIGLTSQSQEVTFQLSAQV